MISLSHEEQDGRSYLVYKKMPEDRLDTFTMEMLSNNRIAGTVPASFLRMNDEVTVKYDITGLVSLKTYLAGTVKREKILSVFASVADVLASSQEYMLRTSSLVFEDSRIYAEPKTGSVQMLVLPVFREQPKPEKFLGELLLGIKYDQTEDCSYIAALINLFGEENSFSIQALKEKVEQLRNEKPDPERGAERIRHSEELYQRENPIKDPSVGLPSSAGSERGWKAEVPPAVNPVKSHMTDSRERQKNMEVLFSDAEEEEPAKERKWPFSRKTRKEEKKETKKEAKKEKGWLSKLTDKKKEQEAYGSESGVPASLAGIAIPGRDPLSGLRHRPMMETGQEEDANQYQRSEIPIPSQRVKIQQQKVSYQEIEPTEYIGQYETEPTLLMEGQENQTIPRFLLHRVKTGENFLIQGDVVRIGRNSSVSEICIPDNKQIGRLHAILYVYEGQVYIEDNGSKNGTYADDKQVKPGGRPVLLLSGSKIRLADEELELRICR